jgi:hypothetical protein
MKKSLFILAACVVSIVSGCGGTEQELDEGLLGQSESALSTCSTTCANGNTISCTGASCSASDGQSVTCDGTSQYCGLIIDPTPLCSSRSSCTNLNGATCTSVGSTRSCCVGSSYSGTCRCMSNLKWSCQSLVDPGPLEPGTLDPRYPRFP